MAQSKVKPDSLNIQDGDVKDVAQSDEQGGFNERLDVVLSVNMPIHREHEIDKRNIKNAIRTLVLEEIIGKDDTELSYTNTFELRNRLRAEQRKKLEDTNGNR